MDELIFSCIQILMIYTIMIDFHNITFLKAIKRVSFDLNIDDKTLNMMRSMSIA